jgi:predicted PurR-regulated permease PerM
LTGFISACCLSLFHWGVDVHLLLVVITYMTGAVLESLILTPWLVGSRSGLHPLWVLFAVFAGGSLAGISGVLVALPVATIIASLWRMERRGDLSRWWRLSEETPPSQKSKKLPQPTE